MLVLEAKLKGKTEQYSLIDEAIRTALFCRNKALRYWGDNRGTDKYDLNKFMAVLAKDFDFAAKLNSQARQSSAERAWSGIAKFFDNCKKQKSGKKGYPKFKKRGHSVEYKTSGWKLSEDRKYLNLSDGFKIGRVKLIGSRDLNFYQIEQIKRVRLVRRADGYYAQFCVDVDRREEIEPTQTTIGLDVGLNHFYTDSKGEVVENPRFLRKSERQLKKLQRQVSKRKKGSVNRRKAIKRLAKKHLQVSRQRKDFAVKTARYVVRSNDLIAYEDLSVRNMVKNHKLANTNFM
jgi:putative transposase